MIVRHTAERLDSNQIKSLHPQDLKRLLKEKYLVLSAMANNYTIKCLSEQIKLIEKAVKEKVKLRKPFKLLRTVPGIGQTLALTIMLETGDIRRFPTVGNFASYARCVPTERLSAGKSKGEGNRKNGNRYLSWTFIEASNFSRRHCPKFQSYYQRKTAKTNKFVATKAISNKLARVCYYIMRDKVPFREEAIFC